MERRPLSRLILAFFGLTSKSAKQFRLNIFKEIHEIVFHGQGGYDWETIYNMPLWLRKYTFHEIKQFYDKKSEAEKSALKGDKKSLIDPSGKINKEQFAEVSKQYKGKTSYK